MLKIIGLDQAVSAYFKVALDTPLMLQNIVAVQVKAVAPATDKDLVKVDQLLGTYPAGVLPSGLLFVDQRFVDLRARVEGHPHAAELYKWAEGRTFEFVEVVVEVVAALVEVVDFGVNGKLDFAGEAVVELHVYQYVIGDVLQPVLYPHYLQHLRALLAYPHYLLVQSEYFPLLG